MKDRLSYLYSAPNGDPDIEVDITTDVINLVHRAWQNERRAFPSGRTRLQRSDQARAVRDRLLHSYGKSVRQSYSILAVVVGQGAPRGAVQAILKRVASDGLPPEQDPVLVVDAFLRAVDLDILTDLMLKMDELKWVADALPDVSALINDFEGDVTPRLVPIGEAEGLVYSRLIHTIGRPRCDDEDFIAVEDLADILSWIQREEGLDVPVVNATQMEYPSINLGFVRDEIVIQLSSSEDDDKPPVIADLSPEKRKELVSGVVHTMEEDALSSFSHADEGRLEARDLLASAINDNLEALASEGEEIPEDFVRRLDEWCNRQTYFEYAAIEKVFHPLGCTTAPEIREKLGVLHANLMARQTALKESVDNLVGLSVKGPAVDGGLNGTELPRAFVPDIGVTEPGDMPIGIKTPMR